MTIRRRWITLSGLCLLAVVLAGITVKLRLRDQDVRSDWDHALPDARPVRVATAWGNEPNRDIVQPKAKTDEPEVPERILPSAVTKREFLEAYWGSRWPTIEQQVEERVPDLDSEIDPATIAPWDEVEADLQAIVLGGGFEKLVEQWTRVVPETLDDTQLTSSAFNKEGKELSESDLQRMRDIVEQFAPSIRAAVERIARQEERFRANIWRDHRFGVGPFHAVWEADPGPTSGPAVSSFVKGWVLDVRIDPDSDPLYGSAMDALWELRDLRRRELIRFTSSL